MAGGATRRCPVQPATPQGPDQVNVLLVLLFSELATYCGKIREGEEFRLRIDKAKRKRPNAPGASRRVKYERANQMNGKEQGLANYTWISQEPRYEMRVETRDILVEVRNPNLPPLLIEKKVPKIGEFGWKPQVWAPTPPLGNHVKAHPVIPFAPCPRPSHHRANWKLFV
jgi:hypothetical protein